VTALVEEFAAARQNPALAVLEGFHAVKHALRFGARPRRLVAVDPGALEQLAATLAPDLCGAFRRLAEPVPVDVFRQLARAAPHTGTMAIADRPVRDPAAILADPAARPVVFLEDPRHLGNVGAVIRVAAAAGAAGVLTSGRCDPWDPAALRGSAGLHFAVPVAHLAHPPAGTRSRTGPRGADAGPRLADPAPQAADPAPQAADPGSRRPLVALDPAGERIAPDALPRRAVLAFGTERHGLSAQLRAGADLTVRIPMRPGVSSLNLATSVAILLYCWTGPDDLPAG